MKCVRGRILTGAALCLAMLAGESFAKPCEVSQDPAAPDRYYSAPQSPSTFRVLSGMGEPSLTASRSAHIPDWTSDNDKALLKLLMPAQDVSSKYFDPYFGDCRIEGPMMTLKARIAALGANHPYIKQWLAVERVILHKCDSGRADAAALPPAMATDDATIARLQIQDRAYQEAALLFYRDTQAALAKFQQIAGDRNSPMRPLAAYMVLAIHAGNKGGYQAGSAALSTLEAVAEIRAALADPSLAEIHAMASSLIGFIGYNTADAPARRAQIGDALQVLEMPSAKVQADPAIQARYSQASMDIGFIFGDRGDSKNEGWVLTGNVPADFTARAALAEFAKSDPLAAWIGFPSDAYEQRWAAPATPLSPVALRYLKAHAGTETTNPWIHLNPDLAAALRASLTDEEMVRLQACPSDEQAAAALAFDFPELMRRQIVEGGSVGEADALRRLHVFPFQSSNVYETTVSSTLGHLMVSNRLTAARKFRDTLSLDSSSRGYNRNVDALILLAEDEDHLVKVLAPANYYNHALLNAVSTTELWRLAARDEFKRGERAMFARSAWSREYALGRTVSAQHNQLMRILNPEVTKSWRSLANKEVTPDDRNALADVLASPGMNIVMDSFSRAPGGDGGDARGKLTGIDIYNHNDNNWWCAWETELRDKEWNAAASWMFGGKSEAGRPSTSASFVARSIDRRELAALAKVDCAPKMLGLRVIAWVKDPGTLGSSQDQAEALANVVLATRYGCNRQGSHRDYSHNAFNLLHSKFEDSAAAKRTRHWFQ
jgi:hypothetical protein